MTTLKPSDSIILNQLAQQKWLSHMRTAVVAARHAADEARIAFDNALAAIAKDTTK